MQRLKHYIPLAAWLVVILTLLLIPAKIISYGYLPMDDALRHAAKVVSGKTWPEILIMRGDFTLDPHPGWHAILGVVHSWQDCSAESLVVVSIFGLMVLVSVAVLPWLRWPEAWLGALLVVAICVPVFIPRLAMGRPYIFTMAVYLALLVIWSRPVNRRPNLWEAGSTVLMIAAAAWIHGSFYQLVLPAAGILFAGRWRQAFWYGGCWALGSFLGASLTGHPWTFLFQCVEHLFGVFGDYTLNRQLVKEFYPSDGDAAMVLAVFAMLIWRSRSPGWSARELLEPIFVMGVLGWVLGLHMRRFWWDWGLPATVLWLTLQFQRQFETWLLPDSIKRLAICGGLAAGLYFAVTSDRDSRWTWNLTNEYLTEDNPALEGWLPEKGGIIYSADMRVFFDTFFKNPKAPWRYVLGFEPGLMRPEDLAVMRKVHWNYGDVRAYQPWIDKMTPKDRLIIRSSWLQTVGAPPIPALEWRYAVRELWVGRLRQTTNAAPAAAQSK